MINNFDKYQLIKEIQTICDIIKTDPIDFANSLNLNEEFHDSDFNYDIILERGGGDSNLDKAKKVWNFISGKGRRIKSLGNQLQKAIDDKIMSPLLARERIFKDGDKMNPDQKSRIREIAKDKEETAEELEKNIKDKIDTIADDDSRLERIAGLVKTAASIKPNQNKLNILKRLDAEDNVVKQQKEKTDNLRDELKQKADKIKELENKLKEKSNSKPNTSSDNTSKSNSEKKEDNKPSISNEQKLESIDKKLEDINNKLGKKTDELKSEKEKLNTYMSASLAHPIQAKVKSLSKEIDSLKIEKIELSINKEIIKGNSDKIKELRNTLKEYLEKEPS